MSKSSDDSCCCRIELVFAAFILRLWVGARLFFAGLDKFRSPTWDKASGDTYGTEWASTKMEAITGPILKNTPIPEFAVNLFGKMLPWTLLAVGLWIIVGLARKYSLLAGGLLFFGLGVGLMLLPDDFEAVQIGVSVAITAFALMVSQHDRISADGIIGLVKGKGSDDSSKD